MAYIKVNQKGLISAAKGIDEYVKRLDKNMQEMDTTVVALSGAWNGKDYRYVKSKWDSINSSQSTTGFARTILRKYAGAIREASKLYREQQLDSIERAKYYCK